MWIVGTDGKPVTYSSQAGWSSNASKDVIRLGNTMLQTTTGTERVNAMMNNSSKINIVINTNEGVTMGSNGLLAGKVTPLNAYSEEVKGQDVRKLTVPEFSLTIYEGSVKEMLNEKSIYHDSNYTGLTMEEAIGAIGGHESEHTEASNVQQQYENQIYKANHNVENVPIETELKIIDELNQQKIK